MTKHTKITLAKLQLALDFNCQPGDFDLDSTSMFATHNNLLRRPFSREQPFFKMASFGSCCVLNCAESIRSEIANLVETQAAPDLFQTETLVRIDRILARHGYRLGPTHELHLHDGPLTKSATPGSGDFDLRIWMEAQVQELYRLPGFGNALQYDANSLRPDILAVTAHSGDMVAGVAAASRDCPSLWQIGVDVLPDFRHRHLGTRLVQALAGQIYSAGATPYYGTWNGNLASRNLALKSGFFPCWIENYAIPE